MSNIAVIRSIEQKTGGVFSPVSFQSASAEYECKRSKTNHGYLYKYVISFKMVGLSSDNEACLAQIIRCESIRITDVNDTVITIGNSYLPLIVTWEDMIEGKPGSFRGTKVKIEWETSLRVQVGSFT